MDAQMVNHRANICDKCEHKRFIMCAKCGCILSAKIRLINSKCPEGKW